MPRHRSQLRSIRTYEVDAVHTARYPGLSSSLAPEFQIMGEEDARSRLNRLIEAMAGLELGMRMPDGPRMLFAYSLVIGTVCIALLLHVMLSAQIMQAEVRIRSLQAELDTINRQNDEIIWEIARATSLTRIQERARALGYVPVQARQYVVMPAQLPGLTLSGATAPYEDPVPPLSSSAAGTLAPRPSTRTWLPHWLRDFNLTSGFSTGSVQPAEHAQRAASSSSAPGWQVWWEQLIEQGAAKSQQWLAD